MKIIWFYPESLFTMAFIPPKNIEFEKRYLFLCRFSLDCSCFFLLYFPPFIDVLRRRLLFSPFFIWWWYCFCRSQHGYSQDFPSFFIFFSDILIHFILFLRLSGRRWGLSDRKSHEKYETGSFVLVFRFSFTPWSQHRPVS